MEIVQYPHPSLITPTKEVTQFGLNIAHLGHEMLELMRQSGGVGLAANQVGIDLSFFVTEKPDGFLGKWTKHKVICNPTWKPTPSGFEYFRVEGCLSLPGWLLPIERYDAIIAEYQSALGNQVKVVLHGFAAQVFQHETEHLDGELFFWRLTEAQRETIRRYYARRK